MKRKIIKMIQIILITIITTTVLFALTNKCKALVDVTEDPDFFKPTEEEVSDDRIGLILGIITVVGVFASVISISIIGIKFMTSSIEEKANYKQALLPWSIGAVLLFSLTTIPSIIYNITNDLNSTNGTNGTNQMEPVTTITLDQTEVILKIGENEQVTLNATIISGTPKDIDWTTSDSQVATVENGKVTAKSKGEAVITAVSGQAKASCMIKVEAAEAALTSDIKISQSTLVLDAPIKNSHQLKAEVIPHNSTEDVCWSSSNPDIVTVNNYGEVKAVGVGKATITAKSGTKSATCTVQVNSERVYCTQYYNVAKNTLSRSRPSGDHIQFLLYIPEVSHVKNLSEIPLIVYLHGGQQAVAKNNADVVLSEKNNPFGLQNKNVNYGAICIFPVSPYKEGKLGWKDESDQMIGNLKKLIDHLKENYNVDEDKIALTGYSNGGWGTWKIGLKYPTLFSCLVPVSLNSTVIKPADVYPDCPVWLFCSSKDHTDDDAETIAEFLRKAGTQVKVDNRGKIPHGDMDEEAYKPDVIKWMIDRSRDTNNRFRF